MYVYLAHPIDQAARQSGLQLAISNMRAMLDIQGHGCYTPAGAHSMPATQPWESSDMRKVDQINRMALFESDAVIAILLPGVVTLGTVVEVEEALTLNRPTCIITTREFVEVSIQMSAWQNRGVRILFAEKSGHVPTFNIAEALCSLPDPTRLFDVDPVLGGPEPLLAMGTAANLRPGKYQGDAGIDLALANNETLAAGEYSLLATGVRVAIPDGYFGLITGRSSTWSVLRCDVRQAIIDSGYRGELMIGLENQSGKAITMNVGTRLAQIILLPVFGGGLQWVTELPEHERALNGYGSSGA